MKVEGFEVEKKLLHANAIFAWGGESKNWREIRVKNEIFSMKIEGFEVVIKKILHAIFASGGGFKNWRENSVIKEIFSMKVEGFEVL